MQVENNYTVYSDGSGHQDGFSGFAAIVENIDTGETRKVIGGMTCSSVNRAEFTAFLEGLELVIKWENETKHIGKRKAIVKWYSDRENLTKAVAYAWGPGKGRDTDVDLWRRFSYYEALLQIRGEHVPRDIGWPQFKRVDLDASTLRMIVKNYDEDTR